MARKPAILDLDAATLSEGKVERWTNRGSAGGDFVAARVGPLAAPVVRTLVSIGARLGGAIVLEPEPDRRPVAAKIAGRTAVAFDGEATVLQSTVPTPATVAGSGPLTVEAWVCSTSPRPVETVFSLAPEAAKKTFCDWRGNGAVECNYGTGGRGEPSAFANGTDAFNTAWEGPPPSAGQWHHLAWVYSGGMFGTLTVYVDGEARVTREHLSLGTYAGIRRADLFSD